MKEDIKSQKSKVKRPFSNIEFSELVCPAFPFLASIARLTRGTHGRYSASPVAQATVGKENQARGFHLHQALLELASERIATGLKNCYVEGKQRASTLTDEDPELFSFFADFIYRDE